MPFPNNPSVGDTYVENNTTYEYLGPVNGWYRKEVDTNNDTTYIGSDGAPGGVSNNTEVIFNDNGSLASDSGLTYNKTTDALSGGAFVPTGSTVPSNGVYLPSANNVAISTNGTGRLFVDSNGKVAIGTNSPAQALGIAGLNGTPGNFTGIAFQAGGSEACYLRAVSQDSSNFALSFGTFNFGLSEKVRLTSDGRLGPVSYTHLTLPTTSRV